VRIIAIINQKGGCGKTTTAINLAAMYARRGLRTLLVDMDPQSHCAAGLGIPENRLEFDIGDALLAGEERKFDFSRLVWPAARNLDLAPSRMRLAGLEARAGGLADKPDKERRLTQVLARQKNNYDVVCIDCSPSIGLLTFNALAAATTVLIPVETGYFSLQGATKQLNTVRTLARRLGVAVPVWMLATIHDSTSTVANDLLEEMKRRFGQRVIPTVIRRDNRLKEAVSFGQPIIDFDSSSPGAQDYAAVANWLLQQSRTAISDDDLPIEDGPAAYDTASASSGDTPAPATAESAPPIVEIASNLRTAAAKPTPTAPLPAPLAVPGISRAEELAQRARALAMRALNSPQIEAKPATLDVISPASSIAPAGVSATLISPPTPTSTQPAMHMTMVAAPVAAPEGLTAATLSSSTAALLAEAYSELNVPAHLDQPTRPHPVLVFEPTPSPAPIPASPVSAVLPALGVRVTRQGVLFLQAAGLGQSLAIAGDFNNWNPSTAPMRLNRDAGVFECLVKLPPGRHAYRLVVDGRWISDPHNPVTELNPFNEPNSIVTVAA
jgi:chromosome partitioning protein